MRHKEHLGGNVWSIFDGENIFTCDKDGNNKRLMPPIDGVDQRELWLNTLEPVTKEDQRSL